jgi:membrane-bound serine protease (ClpP class)
MLTRLALAAQRQRPSTGAAAMVGVTGRTMTAVDASGGSIVTHGEIWQATADESIPPGSRVRITRVDGLHLQVRRD